MFTGKGSFALHGGKVRAKVLRLVSPAGGYDRTLVSRIEAPSVARTCPNLVGGRFREPTDAALLDVTSPHTGGVIGRVPLSSPADVDAAVVAAKHAAEGWRATPVKERTQRLFHLRELLARELPRLASSAATESGKTLAEARAGVEKGIEVVEFATAIQNLGAGGILEVSRGVTCEQRREPLGVVAGITPFNFPAMVPLWMFPIAIALGNAFVLKPSEKVPMTAVILGELMLEAGFPEGVFSIVHGGRETSEAIVAHPDIAAIGFVGSSPVARRIYELGASHGKRVLALGGAKNHIIVAPDAEKDLAAQAIVDSFTGCAGQRCMAGSVLLAVGEVSDVVEEVRRRAAALVPGEGMGAIIDAPALERIRGIVAAAVSRGAKLLLDGRDARPSDPAYGSGYFLGPTILELDDDPTGVLTTEIFGPVLAVVRVKTLADAIAIENRCPFGNAASVFTSSGAAAEYVAARAKAGMIGVNVGVPVPREPFSFGGTKASRLGGGDITGEGGIELWSSRKKITRKWASQPDATWMS